MGGGWKHFEAHDRERLGCLEQIVIRKLDLLSSGRKHSENIWKSRLVKDETCSVAKKTFKQLFCVTACFLLVAYSIMQEEREIKGKTVKQKTSKAFENPALLCNKRC